MGRGRQTQQGQSSAAAAAAAAAPPPQPAAAEAGAVPDDDEGVWRLLLGELWQPPEQQVVCRLLCCSRAMARLVHELCSGRLVASISRQPSQAGSTPEWQQQVTAHGEACSTWLAKHARLLAELRLDVWDAQEQHVAAGLQAAAGVGVAAQRMTRAMAASQRAATRTAEAAAAVGPAAAQQQPQPLPLRSLSATTTNAGGSDPPSVWLLPTLAAACPQLTQLQLQGWGVAVNQQQQQPATALAALRHLRELRLQHCALHTLTALQLSTQLTKLRLVDVPLSAQAFSSLPASLVELEHVSYSELPPAGHLTALTRLECYELDVHSSVQQLSLGQCINPVPLHHLTRLRSLECGDFHRFMACSLEQLQDAVAAIGPSLTSLDISPGGDLRSALLSQRVSGPCLPLTGLTVDDEYVSVAHLGQWTGLTRLALHCVELTETPQQVAMQLQQLTVLRELDLVCLSFSGAPRPSLQPLVDAAVGMSGLRSLRFASDLDAQQRAQLQGMTQLTTLVC